MNLAKEDIPCIKCEEYKKELQEKDTKIKILENNILKIKSLLSESGSLIDGYNEVMEENKNLKIEIENLKNQLNISNNNNYQFELLKQKVLRFQQENQELKATNQFYESQRRGKENIKDSNETKIKRELSLKDKEINKLNTVISLLKIHNNDQQLTNDEISRVMFKALKNKINNNSIDDDEIMFMDNGNNNHELEYRKNTNYFNNNIKMIDLYKEKEFLSDEYQKYKQKYIVYKFKYHEFKKTTKLFLNYMKVIPSGSNISNIFDNFNDKKSLNFIGTKRLKSFNEKDEIKTSDYLYSNINAIRNININNQIRKKSEDNFKDILKMPSLLNNTNTFLDNDNYEVNSGEDNIRIVNTEEKEKNNINENKVTEKRKRGRKKIIELQEEDEEEDNKKSDISKSEEKVKKEPKKRGRKPKKEKEKEKKENKNNKKSISKKKVINDSEDEEKENKENNLKNEKENNIIQKENNTKSKKKDNKETNKKEDGKENVINKDEEKDNIINKELKKDEDKKKEKEEEIEKNKSIENIGPIPKKKKIDPMAQKVLNTNNLLNLLSNTPDKIAEENLNPILSLQNTINEKISFLFEIITSNLIKIELSRVLSLFEVFIDISGDSKTIIGINIIENINSHLNTSSLLNKKIHLKIANKSNDTYKNYINKNYSQAIYLISFLLDILYRKLSDISCVNNFIFQLAFDKNIDDNNKNSMLIVLTNTIKENNMENILNNKIYFKEEIINRYLSQENENKFYFFLSYKNSLISKNIINLILSIYNKNNNNDSDIINHFNTIFNSIPEDEELKINVPKFLEEYKSSIKFNKSIFYLEIFQALTIIVEIKDMKWISENIFANTFWKNFNSSKKDSLKRALCIFYSSVLFYLCLKNGIKNHGNDNLLEQQEFSRLYAWLYGIYNAQQQFENLIGLYDKLCALSWIVESPIMTMSSKVFDTIKEVVNNNIKGEKESLCPTDFLEKLRKLKLL